LLCEGLQKAANDPIFIKKCSASSQIARTMLAVLSMSKVFAFFLQFGCIGAYFLWLARFSGGRWWRIFLAELPKMRKLVQEYAKICDLTKAHRKCQRPLGPPDMKRSLLATP
jgi:hypothetical protein